MQDMWQYQTDPMAKRPMSRSRAYLPSPLTGRDLASFKRRAGGLIIDNVGLSVASGLFVGAVAAAGDLAALLAWIAAAIGAIAYKVGFESRGATPGKMAVGITVEDDQGQPPGVKRAAKRAVLPVAGWIGTVPLQIVADTPGETDFYAWFEVLIAVSVVLVIVLVLDYLWMLWDDRNQTLHDKIGGTYVMRSGSLESREPVQVPPRPVPYWETTSPAFGVSEVTAEPGPTAVVSMQTHDQIDGRSGDGFLLLTCITHL